MNGNCSTTGRNSPERLPDTVQLEHQWKSIDWKKGAIIHHLKVVHCVLPKAPCRELMCPSRFRGQ